MSYIKRLLLALSFAAAITLLILGTSKLYEMEAPKIVYKSNENL